MAHRHKHPPRTTRPERPPNDADHEPAPVDLTCESVAGEEDPGASLDTGAGTGVGEADTRGAGAPPAGALRPR